MGKELEIAECIRRMAGKAGNPFIICKAKNIDDSKMTCDGEPEDGTAIITGIRLVSITGVHASTVVIPEDGSLILVAMLSNTDGYVMHCSKAKKVMIKVGDSTIDISDGLIEMNGGGLHGLVKKQESMDNWNSLKDFCIGLKNATNAVAIAVDASVPGTSTAFQGAMAAYNIIIKDVENTKITQ